MRCCKLKEAITAQMRLWLLSDHFPLVLLEILKVFGKAFFGHGLRHVALGFVAVVAFCITGWIIDAQAQEKCLEPIEVSVFLFQLFFE
jgi:hypothetical protein